MPLLESFFPPNFISSWYKSNGYILHPSSTGLSLIRIATSCIWRLKIWIIERLSIDSIESWLMMRQSMSHEQTHEFYSSYCQIQTSPTYHTVPFSLQRALFHLPLQHKANTFISLLQWQKQGVMFSLMNNYLNTGFDQPLSPMTDHPFLLLKTFNYIFSSHVSPLQPFFFFLAAFIRAGALSPPFIIFFNHHTASGRLPSRKGSPSTGLLPNPSAACLSALRTARSPSLAHYVPLHFLSLFSAELWKHPTSLSVSVRVSRITLCRALDDVRSCRHA